MATGDMYEELTNMISCEICFELLEGRKPRVLTCLHVFCEQCVMSLLQDAKVLNPQTSAICCPVCKQTTNIPGGLATALPLCSYLSKVNDLRQKIEERHRVCKFCRTQIHKANLSSYCFACFCGHCQSCRVKHDKIHPTHPQITVTPATMSHLICKEHDVHLAHFCFTCSKAICSQCCIDKHGEHEIYDLTYNGKNIQQNFKDFLVSGMNYANQKMTILDKLIYKVSQDVERALDKMTRHRDDLIRLICSQYDALRLELIKKQDEIKKYLMESKEIIEDAKKYIDGLQEQVENWYQPVKGIPECRMLNIDQLIEHVRQHMPSIDLTIQPQTLKFISGNGHITFGRIVEEELSYLTLSRSTEETIGETAESLDSVSVSVANVPTLLYKVKNSQRIKDIDYLDDGQLVVCTEKGLCIYDDDMCEIEHYLSDSCKPADGWLMSLCVARSVNKVVVAEDRGEAECGGYLHVYTPDGDTWKYDRYDVCRHPWRVAVTSSGSFIVWSGESTVVSGMSCDTPADYKLYKYNTDGHQSWCRNTSAGWVYDLFVNDNNRIFLCVKDKVILCDEDGHQLYTLSSTGRKLDLRGVCVNENGEVFMSDGRSKSILLSDKGYVFLTSLFHLNFVPEKICLHKMRLAVSSWEGICVYGL